MRGVNNMNHYPYALPNLPYSNTTLEPVIGQQTMDIHYGKHFATYIEKLNNALADQPNLQDITLTELLSDAKILESTVIRNNGGGVFNHKFYFEALCVPKSVSIPEKLQTLLTETFGSVENFKTEFATAATTQFGSGWAFLVQDEKSLKIIKTTNQDTPLVFGYNPLLAIDVWEHAYYLDYQNRRPAYIEAYFDIINWDLVEKRLK